LKEFCFVTIKWSSFQKGGKNNTPQCVPTALSPSAIEIVIYHILLSIVRTFYIENYAEIFPAHYTWKVAEKGFKMAFMMNKLPMIKSCKIILVKEK
jgi:hypothetical protein